MSFNDPLRPLLQTRLSALLGQAGGDDTAVLPMLEQAGRSDRLTRETVLELLQDGLEHYDAYQQHLDTLVVTEKIDKRRVLESHDGADTDVNHAPASALAGGPEALNAYWHLQNRNEAKRFQPDLLSQVYHYTAPLFDFSSGFQTYLIGHSRMWKKTSAFTKQKMERAPQDNLDYFLQLSRDFDNVFDPGGILFDLSGQQQKRPEDYASIQVHPVTYTHTLQRDTDDGTLSHMARFCEKPLQNSAAYSTTDDTIFLHCHIVPLAEDIAELFTDQKKNNKFHHERIRNFLVTCKEWCTDFTQAGLTSHVYKYPYMAHMQIFHEKLHQFHFRCDNAARIDPDRVEQLTGYTKDDALITAVSDSVYLPASISPSSYEQNKLEVLVGQTIKSSLFHTDLQAEMLYLQDRSQQASFPFKRILPS